MEQRKLSLHTEKCFRFKASFSPCLIIELLRHDIDSLEVEFIEMINRTPKFFAGSSVAIDLEKISAQGNLDFHRLKKVFLSHDVIPIGVRGGSQDQHNAAAAAGLPLINLGKSPAPQAEPEKNEGTKLITTPIRSGIQVCAKDGDLIVIGQVSVGAELVAAGNIHVYGPLRGRALAGAYGNREARIFCRQLDAELVSIAGYYLTKEEMSPISDNLVQIYLENEKLEIKTL